MKKWDKILCLFSVICLVVCAIGILLYNNDDAIDLAKGRNSDKVMERSTYWHAIFIMDENLSERGFRF